MREPATLHTADGVALEAERDAPAGAPRAGAVLCHPHPQFGGSMRSIVVGALFEALPPAGVACLRFNFRGVEGSGGAWGGGDAERLDVEAAVAALAADLPAGVPLLLAGWSFGADLALSVRGPAVAAWLAIAPPLRFVDAGGAAALARDPRRKWFVLAEHDEFRDPAEVTAAVGEWDGARVEVVPGASHFFVGRTDRVAAAALAAVDALVEDETKRER